MHFLEDSHALLVPVVDLGEQREIISGVLVEYIVLNDYHLELLHIKPCIHLNRTLINKINNQ